MNWFDIIISLLLLAACVRGIQKGAIMQLTGLAAIILGAIFAGRVAKLMLPFLLNTLNFSLNSAIVISYIFAFIVIIFAVNVAGKMVHGLFKALFLGFINKILGAFVGVVTALIIVSILLNLTAFIDPKEELLTSEIKSESFFYPKVQIFVPRIVPYLNRDLWEEYIPDQFRPSDEEDDQSNLPRELHS